jgi:hypothetical protein
MQTAQLLLGSQLRQRRINEDVFMVEWFAAHYWAIGVGTFLLMWSDWLLTILQERERQIHYAEHYQSYPVNTIEGNPLYQSAVKAKRIVEPKQLIPALIIGVVVAYALQWIPREFHIAFIGYVWGLFLIVDMIHIGNLLGYRAGRRGLHGKLFMHLRTGYVIQMGRYLALAAFLILLAVCSASSFIWGVAFAGLTSALRQLLWLRRMPAIDAADEPPSTL